MREGKDLQDELRLLRKYTISKLQAFEKTLDILVQFARDDLKKLEEFSLKITAKTGGKDDKL